MKTLISNINFVQALLFGGIGLFAGWLIFRSPTSAPDIPVSSPAEGSILWTCSMDPQIKQPEAGDCPICGMDLIPLDQVSTNQDPTKLEMSEAAVQLANIQTLKIGKQTDSLGSKSIYLNGTVRINENRLFSQVAHVGGRIEQLHVSSKGERIRKGQRLATIYSPALISAQKELIESVKLKESIPELIIAAREKLRQWKLSEALIEEVESSGLVRPNIVIYADAAGIVTDRLVAVGDHVMEGQGLLRVANLSRLWVEFDAYPQDLTFLQLGNSITFSLQGDTYTQPISYIDPIIDPASKVARVRVDISNPYGKLRPEMLTKGMVAASPIQNTTISIPQSAIMWTGKRSLVYVKLTDTQVPTFSAREVVLGEKLGESYQITSGLSPGEEIVSYGTFTLDAAAQLNNRTSMMNQAIAIKDESVSKQLETITSTFRAQLDLLFLTYFEIKDALVASDVIQGRTKSGKLFDQLQKVDQSLDGTDPKASWQASRQLLATSLAPMSKSQDLELLRKDFTNLSNTMIQLATNLGISSEGKVYVQFCPMANEDAGGFWLSKDKKISNPYFGDKMMRCGRIEREL